MRERAIVAAVTDRENMYSNFSMFLVNECLIDWIIRIKTAVAAARLEMGGWRRGVPPRDCACSLGAHFFETQLLNQPGFGRLHPLKGWSDGHKNEIFPRGMGSGETDAGRRGGLTSVERERLNELERENWEFRRASHFDKRT